MPDRRPARSTRVLIDADNIPAKYAEPILKETPGSANPR